MNLAYMYAILGKDEVSFKYLNIAEPILKKTDNYFFLAMIEKIKAVNYFNLRDFENAIKYFKISDSMFSSFHSSTLPPLDMIQSLILSNNSHNAKKMLEEEKYVSENYFDSKENNQNHDILCRILCSIVTNNNNDIRAEVDDYSKQSDIEKEALVAWMFFYWAFILFKDKKYINLSYDYLMSFLTFIPNDCKESLS